LATVFEPTDEFPELPVGRTGLFNTLIRSDLLVEV